MSLIQTIKDDLKEARTLKLLSTSFIEISAIKMKTFRQQLAQNQNFYKDIKDIYREVRSNAEEKKLFTQIVPDSELSIALTSNRRFYGTQNVDIVKRFLHHLRNSPTEGLLIGLTGKTYLATVPQAKPIEVILFKDDFPTTREIYDLLDKAAHYEKVFLYHPRFVNLMKQEPAVTDIAYTLSEEEKKKTLQKNFIYEPELTDIVAFFETHVRFLLFRRSLLEVELARTSARLVAMIKSEERAESLIIKRRRSLSLAQKSLVNARLIESLSGVHRWSKV